MEYKSNLYQVSIRSRDEAGFYEHALLGSNRSFESFVNKISLTVFNKLVMNQFLEFSDFYNFAQVSKFTNVKIVKPTIASWDASLVNANKRQIRALWNFCRKKGDGAIQSQENLKEATAIFIKTMKHTRSLDLTCLGKEMTTTVMAVIVEGCPEIVKLTLDFVYLDDKCIFESSKKLQNLQTISFYKCLNIKNNICAFALAHPNLTSIDCSYTDITDQSATFLFENLKQLKEINLAGTQITSKSASIIAKYPQLTILRIYQTKIDNESIIAIINSCGQNLKDIDISNIASINCDVITDIANKCLNIENIDFSLENKTKSKTTDEALIKIGQNCPKLTSFSISNHINLTDRGIIALSHCPLTILRIGNLSLVSDTAIEIITKACPFLRYLDLSGLEKLTSKAFNAIAYHCKSIYYLNILNTNVNDTDIFTLTSQHPRIKNLYIGNLANLTDIGINAIANHCLQLSLLTLAYNPFESFVSKISEIAIANLTNSLKPNVHFELPEIYHEQIHKIKPSLSLWDPDRLF